MTEELKPVAHIFPSTLKEFAENETAGECYSVAAGNPDEETVPLYTRTPSPDALREGVEKFVSENINLDCNCYACAECACREIANELQNLLDNTGESE